jgi:hypothetical protein
MMSKKSIIVPIWIEYYSTMSLLGMGYVVCNEAGFSYIGSKDVALDSLNMHTSIRPEKSRKTKSELRSDSWKTERYANRIKQNIADILNQGCIHAEEACPLP